MSSLPQAAAPLSYTGPEVWAERRPRGCARSACRRWPSPTPTRQSGDRAWTVFLSALRAMLCARFGGDALFLIALWSPGKERKIDDVRRMLLGAGCRQVLSFAVLFWKAPSLFLPHYRIDPPHQVLAAAADVRSAFALMADEHSRREFVGQVAWLMSDDFPSLERGTAYSQYFPDDVLQLSPEEALVDCGAFDGDTIREFLAQCRNVFSGVLAFEPDPANFNKLGAYLAGLPRDLSERIRAVPFALGDRNETLSFAALGTPVSMISNAGGISVACRRLDEVLGNFVPTYLKMDLRARSLPRCAVPPRPFAATSPHSQFASIIAKAICGNCLCMIHSLSADYLLFLRRHGDEFGDVVCYAVPRAAHRRPHRIAVCARR